MMESATGEGGTARRAAIEGLRISAKTGTAQVTDPATGLYSKTDFIASMLGIFPTDDPEVVVYVVIQNPRGESYFGSTIAAPVFRDVALELVDALGFRAPGTRRRARVGAATPARPRTGRDRRHDARPHRARPSACSCRCSRATTCEVVLRGSGTVVRQDPPPGTPVTPRHAHRAGARVTPGDRLARFLAVLPAHHRRARSRRRRPTPPSSRSRPRAASRPRAGGACCCTARATPGARPASWSPARRARTPSRGGPARPRPRLHGRSVPRGPPRRTARGHRARPGPRPGGRRDPGPRTARGRSVGAHRRGIGPDRGASRDGRPARGAPGRAAAHRRDPSRPRGASGRPRGRCAPSSCGARSMPTRWPGSDASGCGISPRTSAASSRRPAWASSPASSTACPRWCWRAGRPSTT